MEAELRQPSVEWDREEGTQGWRSGGEILDLPWDMRYQGPHNSPTILPRKSTEPLLCGGEGWTSCVLGPVTRELPVVGSNPGQTQQGRQMDSESSVVKGGEK